ncbi:GIY-YIG nuclease family protein [Candidatus Pelagibacter ubique]|uniref:GIY-YIG nuclease family protein n=1 Tax=Pelagibacter ubique TaxID=198252 RepID=UPI0003D1ADC2
MSKIVYILTNQSMPDTIKIGITDNLERRMKELDNTSTPLPFECYYAVEVQDAKVIEKKIHEGLDDSRIRQSREFFNTSPEQAKAILEIAEVMGGKNVTPTEDVVETPQDKQALDSARKKRSKFNFGMINIEPGTILEFAKDKTITCEVVDDTKVKFRGEVTSLSASANTILHEMGYDWEQAHGPKFWMHQGKSLRDLRYERE